MPVGKFYGSWTVAVDVSGRVARQKAAPLLTIAAVAVPIESTNQVRARIRRSLGSLKWSIGGLPEFQRAAAIAANFKLPILILHLERVGDTGWVTFWDEAEQVARHISNMRRERVPFGKAAAVVRMYLVARVFARILGHLLERRGFTPPASEKPRARIAVHVVHDSDIQDPETIDVVQGGLQKWADQYAYRISLEPTIDLLFKQEEAEPLLGLADYMAGAFYARESAAPTTGDLGIPLREFKRIHGALLQEQRIPFSAVYPLAVRGDKVVKRKA